MELQDCHVKNLLASGAGLKADCWKQPGSMWAEIGGLLPRTGSPRFPLKGSFKGDIDIDIDVDMDIDLDARET